MRRYRKYGIFTFGCVLGNFISRWFEKLGLFSKADKMVVKATDSLSKATSNAESEENK